MVNTVEKSIDFTNEIKYSYISNYYKIDSAARKGFGLFATSKIESDATIMCCAARDLTLISAQIDFPIAQFLFADPETLASNNSKRNYFMVCGDMVFLNHSDQPNCRVEWLINSVGVPFAQLVSVKKIQPNEELFIRYTDAGDYRQNGYF